MKLIELSLFKQIVFTAVCTYLYLKVFVFVLGAAIMLKPLTKRLKSLDKVRRVEVDWAFASSDRVKSQKNKQAVIELHVVVNKHALYNPIEFSAIFSDQVSKGKHIVSRLWNGM